MTYKTFEIETDEPIPPIYSKYPFEHLNVGESFFVPTDNNYKRIRSIRCSCSRYMKRNKTKHFITRTRIKNGSVGIRVWRVK